jgi:hypothetical protein
MLSIEAALTASRADLGGCRITRAAHSILSGVVAAFSLVLVVACGRDDGNTRRRKPKKDREPKKEKRIDTCSILGV